MKAGTKVSVHTIRRILNKQELHVRKPRRTPFLTKNNIKSRLEFVRKHLSKLGGLNNFVYGPFWRICYLSLVLLVS